ncbi:sensor histidine kinase [Paenibacillus lemnae]|uniref:Circadian input-output histidine kinase CikA n=1 Tax=Paenibacillus lemnae TaxID=1330551 RepID=A0A848MDI4_PAELE|nr:ATP-binding protein [Paenibacillus lemnae]NMO98102.1 sensor histidine kinase [Paenibacillus lemnae]
MHSFLTTFLLNTAVLITTAYLANLFYKYLLIRASLFVMYFISILLLILGGWACSFFGYRLSENIIFDLRFVPLIIATFGYPRAFPMIVIGTGIGLMRFTFGFSEAAVAGFINLTILGILCACLNIWFRKSRKSLFLKGFIVVGSVNLANTLNIALFGVLPADEFLLHVASVTFPLGIVLSAGCALLFYEFYLELRRIGQLRVVNKELSEQKEQLERAQIILEERAKELAIASQYKSEFVANMSHELRTPLNSIINLAQLIHEGDEGRTQEETAEYARLIYHSGYDLLTLVNDVLDLSKVEAGHLDIEMDEVNIREIVFMLHMIFEVNAAKKNLLFELKLSEDVPEVLVSDPHRLNQILRNLLSNAFKFTNEGSVVLQVYMKQQAEEDRRWIVFSVSDTGIGIPQNKQVSIFEAFEQGDASITRKYGGTGLGLSISRDLARLLGGYIQVVSSPDRGSTFSLYLPVQTAIEMQT